jgi:hypothetical protein
MPRLASPDPINDLYREIRDLKRQVQELASAKTLQAATIAQGGVTVTQGASIHADSPTGVEVMTAGGLPPAYNRLDGTPQQGFLLARESGELALALADLSPTTSPLKQALQWLDRARNVVVADDTNSGVGLARPHLNLGVMANTNTATWPSTTATSWTTVGQCYIERQCPGISFVIQTQADTSTSGQFRLTLDGVTIATSSTVTGGFASWAALYYYPAGWSFGSAPLLTLDAIRTAGTGTIRAQVFYLAGVGS